MMDALLAEGKPLLIYEEVAAIGGLGSLLQQYAAERDSKTPVHVLALPDRDLPRKAAGAAAPHGPGRRRTAQSGAGAAGPMNIFHPIGRRGAWSGDFIWDDKRAHFTERGWQGAALW